MLTKFPLFAAFKREREKFLVKGYFSALLHTFRNTRLK